MSSDQRKSIFITGGGGGMGQATARKFAEAGWFVGVFDIDEDGLDVIHKELGSDSSMCGRLDVTSESDFAQAMDSFSERTGGRMDILFNNAGIAPGGWFEEMSTDLIRKVIETNVMGVIYGTRAALPLLAKTENSISISVSSVVATHGHGMRAIYSASKFAVKGLTEALSLEFDRLGVRTADISPGCIDTPMLRNALAAQHGRRFDEGMFETMAKEGPFRLVPATEIADAVWNAYDSTRVHWYVPEDVGDIDRLKGADYEAAREQTRKFLGL
jgi:NAD(P)-dependent dehydrogenase (short-subunit alcohol dehydrogenase family)